MKNYQQSKDVFPLSWPIGFERTKEQESSRFKITLHKAFRAVEDELRKLGATDVIISTDIPLRKDGAPYSVYKLDDTGVAVYFSLKGESTVLCCDKWKGVHENMYSIAKTVEAMRGIDRWGVSDMLKRMFIGFQALPQFSNQLSRPWYEVLEVSHDATQDEIKNSYREKAKVLHPDNQETGNEDKFKELASAYEVGMSK